MIPNRKDSFKIVGVDPGTKVFGLSEWQFEYEWDGAEFKHKASIEDFYAFHLHMGSGWDNNRRLKYVAEYFNGSFAHVKDFNLQKSLLYIEGPPNVGNSATHAELHQFTGAIKAAMLMKGYAVVEVNVATWKAQVIGNGHARKPAIMEWALGGNLPLDASQLQEDSLDALCVGYYGVLRIMHQMRAHWSTSRKRAELNIKDLE